MPGMIARRHCCCCFSLYRSTILNFENLCWVVGLALDWNRLTVLSRELSLMEGCGETIDGFRLLQLLCPNFEASRIPVLSVICPLTACESRGKLSHADSRKSNQWLNQETNGVRMMVQRRHGIDHVGWDYERWVAWTKSAKANATVLACESCDKHSVSPPEAKDTQQTFTVLLQNAQS